MATPSTPHLAATDPEDDEPLDLRVAIVLAVLGGTAVDEVADHFAVEPALVARWVRIYCDAGAARLANRPEPDLARQRDRFLAAFAHELRTPLAVAQGWASVLADGDVPPDLTAQAADKLSVALEVVAERTAALEQLTAAALGRLEVDRSPVLAADLVPAALDLTAVPSPAPVVHTDADLARRVVRDLDRAARVEPAPDRRWVEVHLVEPWVEIHVVREGAPVEERVLHALFEPFERNDDDTGVTTGLYPARVLAVALGGAVGVEQDDDRTAFWVRLPQDVPTT